MQEYLINRGGLLNFVHDYLRQAVGTRYASNLDNARTKLINFFTNSEPSSRKADELPWLYMVSNNLSGVYSALTDIEIFVRLYTKRAKFELIRYWLQLTNYGYDSGLSYYDMITNYAQTRPSADKLAKYYAKTGRFLREVLKFNIAENLLTTALKLNEEVFGEYSSQVGKIYYLLAECFWNQGKMEEARPYATKSLEIREKILGSHHLEVAMSLCGLGELLIEKEPATAKPLIQRALNIRIEHFGDEHPLVGRCLQDLAVISDNEGNSDEAVRLCSRAVEVREKTLGTGHPHLAASLETLGTIYKLRGEFVKAEQSIKRALDIFKNVHGEVHPSVLSCYEWLAIVLKDQNKTSESEKCSKIAKQIDEKLKAQNYTLGERIAD